MPMTLKRVRFFLSWAELLLLWQKKKGRATGRAAQGSSVREEGSGSENVEGCFVRGERTESNDILDVPGDVPFAEFDEPDESGAEPVRDDVLDVLAELVIFLALDCPLFETWGVGRSAFLPTWLKARLGGQSPEAAGRAGPCVRVVCLTAVPTDDVEA